MNAQRLRRAVNNLSLLAIAMALASCGDQSDADAAANTGASGDAAAAPPASLPPAALAAWEAYAREQCALDDSRFTSVTFVPLSEMEEQVVEAGQQTVEDRGGFIAADFNGDGRPDFVVATSSHGCATQGPAYGSSGPPNDFILSTADGYLVVDGFMGWTGAATIERRGERDMLVYAGGNLNGSCGTVARVVWGWTGREMDVLERRNERGEIVDQEGCTAREQAASAGSATFPPLQQGIYAGVGERSHPG